MPKKIKTYTLDDDVVKGIVALSAKHHKPQSEIINIYMRFALQKLGVLQPDALQAEAQAVADGLMSKSDELAATLQGRYRPAKEGEPFEVLTATAIATELWSKNAAHRYSSKAVGQKLRTLGFVRLTVRLTDQERPTGYKVVRL